ncbi:uncharacterized protein K460DRAFT_401093 [Cucurbitaria berberidis CBS 394.84]|uniref:MaoC-like domain-containing protein n=1 Tax=Cucurbitaria berberidis CBS 394.84 TaxID=1168544 RepID=A0A9P4GU27_9PLEO|nr:uncharacterized protein K460DRAFT_401093 [Cucurbitaria berberidis CBS 394.84]KAF1851066.1 hypothetical protein K460DRAFT_401093 [Cucurbitaria berberidis CBS 394.84]
MLLRTPYISRIARTPAHGTTWRRTPGCYYSTSTDDPPWFQQLRAEMLHRDITWLLEDITAQPEHRLSRTLSGFLPDEWCRPPSSRKPVLPVGHHLIWFNLVTPSHKLLPDGTDDFHSPAAPWVRRMWAGGSVRLKPDEYFHKKSGFTLATAIAGAERIKDVQLRGKDDAAKVFVTIERRFARLDQLYESHQKAYQNSEKSNVPNVQRYFKEQLRNDEEWGSAILKEERNLVFFKERTAAQLDVIKSGQMAPVRYLDPPGKPDFSHTLTPTRSLLFRYSALTFNAHLIHLDRDYARNVEGHRNLLVHGPLSLTLILQAVSGYVNTHTEGKQVIESIEYRNLAPLYCDEQMSICGMEKNKSDTGSTFEIWIEGPTGGMAVKGIVRTVVKRPTTPTLAIPPTGKISTPSENQKLSKPRGTSRHMKESRLSEQAPAGDVPIPPNFPRFVPLATPDILPGNAFSQIAEASLNHLASKPYRQLRPTRTISHQFITMPSSSTLVRRVEASPKPVRPTMSPLSVNIMRRRLREQPPKTYIKPIPLLRKYDAISYKHDAARTAARHSRFRREGARKVEKLEVRLMGRSLEGAKQEAGAKSTR